MEYRGVDGGLRRYLFAVGSLIEDPRVLGDPSRRSWVANRESSTWHCEGQFVRAHHDFEIPVVENVKMALTTSKARWNFQGKYDA